MSNYQKIWGLGFGLTIILIFSLIIYGSITSDNSYSILKTIYDLDETKVNSIVIAPSNPKWKINLTLDTVTIENKEDINKLITALKSLSEKHLPKGYESHWHAILTINLLKNHPELKNKDKLVFRVYDTKIGLIIEMTNTMGIHTYQCPKLKLLLENLTHFKEPRGE